MPPQTDVLSNARNVSISDTNFIVHNNAARPISSGSPEQAQLFEHSASGALLHSNERFNPPRCTPGTRKPLLASLRDWINGGGQTSSGAWLTGSPGSGKSAVCQTISEEMKEEGILLACHFFSRTSDQGYRSDGKRLVPTLVSQLVNKIPETRTHVESAIQHNPATFSQQPETLFRELFVEPLRRAVDPDYGKPQTFSFMKVFERFMGIGSSSVNTNMRRLVVIDGLDECSGQPMQIHLLRMVIKAISQLPVPVRFLIACRPESHLRTTFNQEFAQTPLVRFNLDDNRDAVRKDIRLYFEDRFNKIRRDHPSIRGRPKYDKWPSPGQLTTLILRSSTQFIFADTVMNYVSHERGNPHKRLATILDLSGTYLYQPDKPYLPLDTIYAHMLLEIDDDDRPTVLRILEIVYLSGTQEFSGSILQPSPIFIESLLNLEEGDVNRLLDPLISILAMPELPSGRIGVLHASFFDYLRSPVRSGTLGFSLGKAHEQVALFIFDQLKQVMRRLPSSSDRRAAIEVYIRFLRHAELADLAQPLRSNLENLDTIHDDLFYISDSPSSTAVSVLNAVEQLITTGNRHQLGTPRLQNYLSGIMVAATRFRSVRSVPMRSGHWLPIFTHVKEPEDDLRRSIYGTIFALDITSNNYTTPLQWLQDSLKGRNDRDSTWNPILNGRSCLLLVIKLLITSQRDRSFTENLNLFLADFASHPCWLAFSPSKDDHAKACQNAVIAYITNLEQTYRSEQDRLWWTSLEKLAGLKKRWSGRLPVSRRS